jgi:hypothetical protein
LVLAQLESLIERGVPLLMVGGAEDTDERRMRRLFARRFPDLAATSFEMTSVAVRTLKGFRSVPAQGQFIDVVDRWIQSSTARAIAP